MPKKSRTSQKKAPPKKSKVKPSSSSKKAVTTKTKVVAQKQGISKLWKPGKYPKAPDVRLPNVWQLTKTVASVFWTKRKLFIGIVLIYALLNLFFAQGLANGNDVANLKSELSQIFNGHYGATSSGVTTFLLLLGSNSNNANSGSSIFQICLLLIASLALIWSLRQIQAGNKIRIRDAFYKGMYPLVPFLLVLVVIALQLIPLLLGSTLYVKVITNNLATTGFESAAWLVIFLLTALLSFYWVCSSVFALYIVTLPNMTPVKALRSARELVRYRRLIVMRKLLFLPIALFIIGALLVVPAIIVSTFLAQWLYLALTILAIAVVQIYMYSLYRELIRE